MSDNKALIVKYRPSAFDEMVGHVATINALKRAIHGGTTPHGYLFTGVAGLGKTTLARITAAELNAEILEIDAASNNGIDDVRALIEMGNHMSFNGEGRRAFIIDECHSLSKAAWQALLKIIEEPPPHLYLMLCTTDADKVPDTIKSRCYPVGLRPLKPDEMLDLLDAVAGAEAWDVHPDVMHAVVEASTGQPRKALSMLQAVHDAPSRDEVRRIINIMSAGEPLYDLCKAIVDKKGWAIIKSCLAKIDDSEFDNAGIMVGRFLAAAMGKADSEKSAQFYWTCLDALLFPTETFDRKAAFYAAIGRIVWGRD